MVPADSGTGTADSGTLRSTCSSNYWYRLVLHLHTDKALSGNYGTFGQNKKRDVVRCFVSKKGSWPSKKGHVRQQSSSSFIGLR